MTTVGAYEAKSHLSQLLDEVVAGNAITITRHGQPVARLVPVPPAPADPSDVIAALKESRRGIRRGRVSVRSMIEEGRT
ncbi:MAG: type II toxin-antitoxin system prevent-host-death family antitoxin [Actinomycetota bacterium]|jgi:prevent-host-death family protein|nr:type II toxin-antitoxin system prevent-host-death family antitoxin [Actinomycetota bacterium]